MIEKLLERIQSFNATLIVDGQRRKLQFFSVYFILTVVSSVMTVVNVFTQRYTLMLATMMFAVANLINLLLSVHAGKGRQAASILLSVEMMALFLYFIISGEPEGFSAIWICMLPTSGLLLFGKKRGSALCGIELAVLIFFFYLPFGRSLLRFQYTDSFLLRFPILYTAFFSVAYFLESIREATYDALQESRRQYKHLYSHDALTNVYNRYGFNEHMDALLRTPQDLGVALLILDIDYFKNVNDRYGHPWGDVVLKEVAALLVRECGESATVCRWGGEEFAVILPSTLGCEGVAENILRNIRTLGVKAENETIYVTVSIGMVISSPLASVDPAALVTQADRCLYMAKENGRNCIVQMPFTAAPI